MNKATTIKQMFQEGVRLHRSGRLVEAESIYGRILEMDAFHFDSLHLLGACLIQRGQAMKGIQNILQAIKVRPDSHEAYFNLGNGWYSIGSFQSALSSFQKAIDLHPTDPEYHFEKGNSLKALNRPAEALECFKRAVALNGDYVQAAYGAGLLSQELKQFEDALSFFEKTIQLKPRNKLAYLARADLYAKLGRYQEALNAFTLFVDLFPMDENAHLGKALSLRKLGRLEESALCLEHARASLKTSTTFDYQAAALIGDATSTAPPEYVQSLFDNYADGFDKHLVGQLSYNSPERMYLQFTGHFTKTGMDCLDLGCGTGLGVMAYRESINSAVGVDLSEKMLEKAKAKNVYTELFCSDVAEFLQKTEDRFDLVLAFDVFIYIGDLERIFQGVRRVLRSEGIFAFTLEGSIEKTFELKETARFGHSRDYVHELASKHGFDIAVFKDGVIRKELGVDIKGFLVHLVVSN
jgi:predicted TPR repeat methyltransferase